MVSDDFGAGEPPSRKRQLSRFEWISLCLPVLWLPLAFVTAFSFDAPVESRIGKALIPAFDIVLIGFPALWFLSLVVTVAQGITGGRSEFARILAMASCGWFVLHVLLLALFFAVSS